MGAYQSNQGDQRWLEPMLKDDSGCGPECPPDGCQREDLLCSPFIGQGVESCRWNHIVVRTIKQIYDRGFLFPCLSVSLNLFQVPQQVKQYAVTTIGVTKHHRKSKGMRTRYGKSYVPLQWSNALEAQSKAYAQDQLSTCGTPPVHGKVSRPMSYNQSVISTLFCCTNLLS